MFWIDLLALLPVDLVLLCVAGHFNEDTHLYFGPRALEYFQLSRCLRMVRPPATINTKQSSKSLSCGLVPTAV